MLFVFARWRKKLQTIIAEACACETRLSPHAQLWRWLVATLLGLLELPDRVFKEGLKKALDDAGKTPIDFGLDGHSPAAFG